MKKFSMLLIMTLFLACGEKDKKLVIKVLNLELSDLKQNSVLEEHKNALNNLGDSKIELANLKKLLDKANKSGSTINVTELNTKIEGALVRVEVAKKRESFLKGKRDSILFLIKRKQDSLTILTEN